MPSHIKKYDPRFIQWLIGFVEGDGSFIISNNKPYFDLSQNLRDIDLLHEIRTTLGFGKVLKRTESTRYVGVFYITHRDNFIR
jgi:hypothetical protein